MSKLLVPGWRRTFLPTFPNVGWGGCAVPIVGGPKRSTGGALGLATMTRIVSEGDPLTFAGELTRLYPGVKGPPDSMRVTPDNSQLSAIQCTGRKPLPFRGWGSFQG